MRKFGAAAWAAAVLCLGFGGAATAGEPVTQASLTTGATFNNQTYKIGPQDTLEVEVFQVPDLSKTSEVDATGNIRLPLIGEVQAAGRTPAELSDLLEQKLRSSYVKDPEVLVTVKESSSRRVTVDGAVIQPGIYPLSGPTTLLQAVALARGPDPREANLKRVAIFRNVNGERQTNFYDLSSIRAGKMADPAVYPDDVVVVDTSRGKSLLRDLSGALPILNLFRMF